jgi:hypothetical protein
MTAILHRAALTAVGRGWRVFPVEPGGKRPAVDRWEQRATADPEYVSSAWSGRWSGYNVGVACGPSRLIVVDLDRHGELPQDWCALPGVVDGLDVFAQLLEWAGESRLPETYWMATPSGGWHYYFTSPEGGPPIRNSAGLLGPAVDVRGAGGYVVAAGSVGRRAYEILDDRSPAPPPAWIVRRLTPQPRLPAPVPRAPASCTRALPRLRGLLEHVRSGPPGDRNGRLFWAACRLGELVASGQTGEDAGELLVAAALDAGLRGGEPEARRTVASGLRAGGGR